MQILKLKDNLVAYVYYNGGEVHVYRTNTDEDYRSFRKRIRKNPKSCVMEGTLDAWENCGGISRVDVDIDTAISILKRWVDSILDPVKIIPTEVFNRMHPYHVALTEELKRINQYYESIGLHFRELILVKPKSTNPGTFVLLNAKTLESLKASHTPEVFFTFRMSVVDILDAKGSLTSDSEVPIDLLAVKF